MKALEGLRMLDITHMLSGPYAGMLLADLGMETIKIEPLEQGEGTRRLLENDPDYSLNGVGAYFLTLNRNKKSVALNLKSEEGRALFYELVKTADVVLTNFSVGVTQRLGIDHETLAEHNPRIVTCAISGFGETGPNRHHVSFDIVAQGTGGGMSITGAPEGPPTRSGIPTGDLGGGLMATIGILAALQARVQTGRGQHVDISMQDAQISMLNYMATMHFLSGKVPTALANGHFVHVPYDTFEASDGWFLIAVILDQFWDNLMAIVDAPDLNTEENRRQPGRKANKDLINRRLGDIFKQQTKAYWLQRLRDARIPCAPVNDLGEALSDPQVLARDMVVEVTDVHGDTVLQPGNPIKLSDTDQDTFTAPPTVGQHTDEVLLALGLTSDQLDELRTWGAIG
ncbi:MAG: acyl-CoA transferase [Deltaproteobacteria bacterium]|nr:acyl-CoA transferase [Deltaproteobacteria bacterium]